MRIHCFIFTSDNGAEGSNVVRQDGNSLLSRWFETVGYNTDYETLGEANSLELHWVKQRHNRCVAALLLVNSTPAKVA